MSLISRKLLTPDEVLKIENPYILVMIAGKPLALLNVPDISKTHFNKLNGMGTKEENQKLRIARENARKVRKISKSKIWNIWDQVKQRDLNYMYDEEELQILRKRWQEKEKGEETFENQKRKNEQSD